MIRKKTYIGYADTIYGDGFSTTDKDKPYLGRYEGIDIDYILQTGGENLVINSAEIEYIGEVYLAQDDDFVKVNNRWVYRGSELEIEIPHTIQGEEVTAYDYMFYGAGDYSATPVTRVDSNNKRVTNMSDMFRNSSATTLDLSSFDTSNVTRMGNMFRNSSATTLDLSSFDTSNVTDMSYMFQYCSGLTSLDLSSFDTSNVNDMRQMFTYCNSLTSLDVSNFDTSKVTDMSHMFGYLPATTLDLSSFNTSNVTNMSYMFQNCRELTSLDVSSFDTSNVTTMNNMFRYCTSLTLLDLSSFDTSNVTSMNDMFRYCSSITTGYARTQADADKFNASSNKPAGLTFVVKP